MFEGKRILITGGSSGIGLALAEKFADRGAHLWLLARDQDRLERAAKKVRGVRSNPTTQVDILAADVSDGGLLERTLSSLRAKEGTPDILVNSAGLVEPGYAEELEIEDFRRMMDVNYFGTVHTIHYLLPSMLERGSGHIVNISSMTGVLGIPGYTAYGASKFAVSGYSDALRAELKGTGVRLSIVYPPDTQTPQLEYEMKFRPPITEALVGDGEPLSPADVAESIVTGIRRGRYVIFPDFESRFYYWLNGVLGTAAYSVMDLYLARARLRMKRGNQER